ncbi:hypothetical protein Nepgr_032352 [Nepenthes gracilis]|uniref:Uncharacterized protein n=1 Tax=Nepenthes gracilis TaxID=150966 RepID=A0AAD3Y7T8_NEPGR|nr:hypothetical protein Nepgr_032352 [Nepenthes gracilis]
MPESSGLQFSPPGTMEVQWRRFKVQAIKEVDVVISTVGHALLMMKPRELRLSKKLVLILSYNLYGLALCVLGIMICVSLGMEFLASKGVELEDCIAIHVLLEGTFLDHDAESSEFFYGFCHVFLEVDCETMEGLRQGSIVKGNGHGLENQAKNSKKRK